ncbi:SDR family oxidoreductase [Portibacter lacus]|uniref:Epimerase n=1 Tax=Portibacter lacus TaxID=1099794 RepID=A0AA37SSB8_9BACT|nr:SDR family oxidoreductase [Portibacter lacus]GLR19508.1 epimerase [Portibacter lacus]
MRILLTGATGYIGKRLLPVLVQNGHHVICCVRDINRFSPPESVLPFIDIIQVDFLDKASLSNIPNDIDAAYYLIHSMSSSNEYVKLEEESAKNFRDAIDSTALKQVIYLSGIVNEDSLSKHLKSRKNVENILSDGSFSLSTLRAGIIIGSGSASFEIIRDLVEKLPIMIAPKWLNTKCQPIGIRDVLTFLEKSLLNEKVYDQNYDIGGPDVLTYKEMLLEFAKFRKLSRRIYTVPVMTPRLSSYWLYFVTSTSYNLAKSLVASMKIEVVCRDTKINDILNVEPEDYRTALKRAFTKIDSNQIVSSWKDSQVSGVKQFNISDFIDVPSFGCFKDVKEREIVAKKEVVDKIWNIGGSNGWYYANILWKLRGFIDKLFGGVGLRRGRSNPTTLESGDALDFWRVLYANKSEGRLLLFAEMKLPGEAWLEFKIKNNKVIQTATFRPHGIPGRLYWYAVLPFHGIVFNGMINELTKVGEGKT